MSFDRRLERLEAKAARLGSEPGPYVFDPTGTRPKDLAHRVYFKEIERHRARAEGREPPAYDRAEIERMREDDLETVAGGGAAAWLRGSPGWQSEEGQATLDAWEAGARRRMEAAKDLQPELWGEVWGADETTEEEGS